MVSHLKNIVQVITVMYMYMYIGYLLTETY